MDMYKLKWTQLQLEIFRLLCIKAGNSMSLREISRLLKKSPTGISNVLQGLEKDGLIKIKKSKNMNLLSIELNRDNQDIISMKRVENLKLAYESGLVNFLYETFPGTTIILFGSYSLGEDVIDSDIDIALIGAKEKSLNLIEFNKRLERKIILNFYPSFKEIHKHLRENILNGILLKGSVEL